MTNTTSTDPDAALQATLMAQMGESYAANRAWMATLQKEDGRLNVLNTRATRLSSTVAEDSMDVAYTRNRTQWITMSILITTFGTLCILAPAALFRTGIINAVVAYTASGIAAFVYFVVIFVLIRNVAFRRRDDWDRYYFQPSGAVKTQSQRASAASAACPSTA